MRSARAEAEAMRSAAQLLDLTSRTSSAYDLAPLGTEQPDSIGKDGRRGVRRRHRGHRDRDGRRAGSGLVFYRAQRTGLALTAHTWTTADLELTSMAPRSAAPSRDVAEAIRRAGVAKFGTQAATAAGLGIFEKHLNRVCNAHSAISAVMALGIEATSGVDAAWIVHQQGEAALTEGRRVSD